jgi:hypothetical protein
MSDDINKNSNADDYMGSKYSEHIFKEAKIADEKSLSSEQQRYDNLTKDIYWKETIDQASTYDKKQTLSIYNITQ